MVERLARAIRHTPALRRMDRAWDTVRPAYDLALRVLFGRRGLRRVVNGSEPIRLDPRCRNVPMDYEPAVWNELLGSVESGDVVADVGANVGLYAVALARRVGPTGRVIAYEPDAANAELLCRNIELNGVGRVVEVCELAVGSAPGELPFLSDRQQSRVDPAGESRVRVVALDDELERIALLKIDVEGLECDVLDGARSLLADERRRPRRIFVEAHLARLPELGRTEEDVTTALERAGYAVTELSFDGLLARNYVADAASSTRETR
jgi:FkbM family methyltransferase